jgi:hypothetical protein
LYRLHTIDGSEIAGALVLRGPEDGRAALLRERLLPVHRSLESVLYARSTGMSHRHVPTRGSGLGRFFTFEDQNLSITYRGRQLFLSYIEILWNQLTGKDDEWRGRTLDLPDVNPSRGERLGVRRTAARTPGGKRGTAMASGRLTDFRFTRARIAGASGHGGQGHDRRGACRGGDRA